MNSRFEASNGNGVVVSSLEELPLQLVELDYNQLDQICDIERLSFPAPWSRQLFLNEFVKRVSYRPGLVNGEQLVAQSFNHVVKDELHILNLAVHPQFRRQGLARRLLAIVLQTAAERGVTRAFLEVRKSNVAGQALYRGFGFHACGVRSAYYHDNKEDALVFERKIGGSERFSEVGHRPAVGQ